MGISTGQTQETFEAQSTHCDNGFGELLTRAAGGDSDALRGVLEAAYPQVRLLAGQMMAREPLHRTLETTALVHEAYLRMLGAPAPEWRDPAHFLRYVAKAMRHVLIQYARAARCQKRQPPGRPMSLDDIVGTQPDPALTLAIDELLAALIELDPLQAQIVELRWFLGLTVEEAAVMLDITPSKVSREWQHARAWLVRHLDTT